MSLASNATDQQVGKVIEVFLSKAPEVASQAVEYYRVVDSVWLGVFLAAGVFSTVLFFRCLSLWRVFGADKYVVLMFTAGWGVVLCLIGVAACTDDLVKLNTAPDYYAAECLAKLLRR